MTNAEILVQALDEWATPIIEAAVANKMKNNMFADAMSQFIKPQYLIQSAREHLGLPYVHDAIKTIPDKYLPDFSVSIIDGMIETRKEIGALSVPYLGARLSPEAFQNLKKCVVQNFAEYSQTIEIPTSTAEVEELKGDDKKKS